MGVVFALTKVSINPFKKGLWMKCKKLLSLFLFVSLFFCSPFLKAQHVPEAFAIRPFYPLADTYTTPSVRIHIQTTVGARCSACLDATHCEPLSLRTSDPFRDHYLSLYQLSEGAHRLQISCNTRELIPQLLDQELRWNVVSLENMPRSEDSTAPIITLLRPLDNAEVSRNFSLEVNTDESSNCGLQLNPPPFGNGLRPPPLVVLDMESEKGIQHYYTDNTIRLGEYSGEISCYDRSANRSTLNFNFRVSENAEATPEIVETPTEAPETPNAGSVAPPTPSNAGQVTSEASDSNTSSQLTQGANSLTAATGGSGGGCSISNHSFKTYNFFSFLGIFLALFMARFSLVSKSE